MQNNIMLTVWSVIGIISFVVLVWIAVNTIILVKKLVWDKFMFGNIYQVNVDNNTKTFCLSVANRSLGNATITEVGIISGLQHFNFMQKYREKNKIINDTVTLSPRTKIDLCLSIDDIRSTVLNNLEGQKLTKLYIYVIDSIGKVYKGRAKNYEKVLINSYIS